MKIGVVVGTFDLFHIGHLNLLKRAKANCDLLIAGVNMDSVVLRDKNKVPVICEDDRLEIIKNISCVSEAFLVENNAPQFIGDLLKKGYNLNFYFRGYEPIKPNIEIENNLIKSMGVDVVQFPYTDSISTTMIRDKLNK